MSRIPQRAPATIEPRLSRHPMALRALPVQITAVALVGYALWSDGVGAEPPMFRGAGRTTSLVQWMVMLPPLRTTGVDPVVKTAVPERFLITTLIVSPFFPPEAPLSTTDTWKV